MTGLLSWIKMILELRYLDDPCKSLMALLEMTQHRLDVALGALLFIERTVGNPNHHTSGLTSLPDSQGDMCLTSIYTWLAERARVMPDLRSGPCAHAGAVCRLCCQRPAHRSRCGHPRHLQLAGNRLRRRIHNDRCSRLWSPVVACGRLRSPACVEPGLVGRPCAR